MTRDEIEAAVAERAAARQRGDFQTADAIRAKLHTIGVEVEDRKDGTSDWRWRWF